MTISRYLVRDRTDGTQYATRHGIGWTPYRRDGGSFTLRAAQMIVADVRQRSGPMARVDIILGSRTMARIISRL